MRIFDRPGFFDDFPRLNSKPAPFIVTSAATRQYNCVAWAMGDTSCWWWPSPVSYWPGGCPTEVTIESFATTFASLGWCKCQDGAREKGIERVALYAKSGEPTHVARQLPNDKWTSKIGANVDIEHTLEDLQGPLYGTVVGFFRKAGRR